jgi:mono/diheme cytochrome c family protein
MAVHRRRLGYALVGVVAAGVVAGAAFFFWPADLEDVSAARAHTPSEPTSVRRGEYLARAADCAACHTIGNGAPYAGGLAFNLPIGTIYATNITPDKETGIGNWSDAEFVRALRHGVGRAGQDLYPAFPYTAYALMSTEDALAIKDYLFTVPPARSMPPAARLSFPFDQRYIMRAWKLLFMPSGPYKPDPQQPADWNRGAYLVEGLGHCGECHTPRNQLFALDKGQAFAGAVTAGWKAYNLTSDKVAGIGAWSDAQIADYLSNGHADGRGSASGSMAEAVSYSLRFMSTDDIRAMVVFLRAIPRKRQPGDVAVDLNPPLVKSSTASQPAAEEASTGSLGLTLFQGACASCHGWNGDGLQHAHAALVGSQTVNDVDGMNLMQVIIRGSRMQTNDGEVFMPAFGKAYSDAEIAALVNYVILHFGAKQSSITLQT